MGIYITPQTINIINHERETMKKNINIFTAILIISGCQSQEIVSYRIRPTTTTVHKTLASDTDFQIPQYNPSQPDKTLIKTSTEQDKEIISIDKTKVFSKELFYEIVKNSPKADKFSSTQEISNLTTNYLDKYNNNAYRMQVKLVDYSNAFKAYTISKQFRFQIVSNSRYDTTNGFGAKITVKKSYLKSDSIQLSNQYLKVSGNIAREINGKLATLIFKNIQPAQLRGGQLCGISYIAPTFRSPYEFITDGCTMRVDGISLIVDEKEYPLSDDPI